VYGPCYNNALLTIAATFALGTECGEHLRCIWHQVVPDHRMARCRECAIADTCIQPIAMDGKFLRPPEDRPLSVEFGLRAKVLCVRDLATRSAELSDQLWRGG